MIAEGTPVVPKVNREGEKHPSGEKERIKREKDERRHQNDSGRKDHKRSRTHKDHETKSSVASGFIDADPSKCSSIPNVYTLSTEFNIIEPLYNKPKNGYSIPEFNKK